MIQAFFLKYKLMFVAAGALVLVSAVVAGVFAIRAGVFAIRASAYAEGRAFEREIWAEAMRTAEARADTAAWDLYQLRISRALDSQARTEARTVIVRETRTEIANAATTEARYGAYLAGRERLRDAGAEDFARARTDYLSTVPAEPGAGPSAGRPELRFALERRRPSLPA